MRDANPSFDVSTGSRLNPAGARARIFRRWVFPLPNNNDCIAKNHGVCCCWMAEDLPLTFPAEINLVFLCWVIPPVFSPL